MPTESKPPLWLSWLSTERENEVIVGWVLGYSFAYHELMVAWILSRGGGGDGWVRWWRTSSRANPSEEAGCEGGGRGSRRRLGRNFDYSFSYLFITARGDFDYSFGVGNGPNGARRGRRRRRRREQG